MIRIRRVRHALAAVALAASVVAAPRPLHAEEGMWTLDNLPGAVLSKNGFTPTPDWIAHVRGGCVSFGGGSGSFVSPHGLVLTNHHVALNQLQKMSTAEHDYVHDGFYARTGADEIPCPDLELKVLTSTEDVTARVTGAIDPRASAADQDRQRRAIRAKLSEESTRTTGLKSDVVELYHGGEYWLYRYHTYKDVRLVMAPEEQAAFYGGDLDNFCYPRHDLDMAFFRVYDNGKPLENEHWFKLNRDGVKEGDLVFVAGHPGSTSRDLTVAQLEYQRDRMRPIRIAQQEHMLAAIRDYATHGPEEKRRALDRVRVLENNLKRERAFLDVLKEPGFMDQRRAAESGLKSRVAGAKPALPEAAGAWDRIAAAQRRMMQRHREYLYRTTDRGSRLVAIAERIVRYVAETAKPNEQRLTEYVDSNLSSQRFQMFSPAPTYPDLDEVVLAAQLQDALDALGPKDPWVRAALGGRTPAEAAHAVISGSKLADVNLRHALVDGGATAIEVSTDPLIVWERNLDPLYRELRTWYEQNVSIVESVEGGRIARARFALDGRTIYPDATGTLRLSPGHALGYEQLTTRVPWKTTFLGLYDRAQSFGGAPPFQIPERIARARARLDLDTPLNFVTTSDIIGGNSGSPVLNRDLDLVGLIFDGNTQAFRWQFQYDDTQGRAVAVHAAAILESLRKVYDMEGLADELEGSRLTSAK